MPKVKQQPFTCAAHWYIKNEKWVGRGWHNYHEIGRCEFWNARAGNHKHNEYGRCTKYPDVKCPWRGVKDYTELQAMINKKMKNPVLYPNQFDREVAA